MIMDGKELKIRKKTIMVYLEIISMCVCVCFFFNILRQAEKTQW
jgi:hypothetical protein